LQQNFAPTTRREAPRSEDDGVAVLDVLKCPRTLEPPSRYAALENRCRSRVSPLPSRPADLVSDTQRSPLPAVLASTGSDQSSLGKRGRSGLDWRNRTSLKSRQASCLNVRGGSRPLGPAPASAIGAACVQWTAEKPGRNVGPTRRKPGRVRRQSEVADSGEQNFLGDALLP